MSDTETILDTRPTQFSINTVVYVTLAMTVVLVNTIGLTTRVLYGAAGAILLSSVLWLLSTDRYEALGAALGALTAPLIGLTLLAGTGYTVAAQLRNVLPVGSVFLVVGATVAIFGALTATRTVLDRDTLSRCLNNTLRTTMVVAAAMTIAAMFKFAHVGQQLGLAAQVVFTPSAAVPLASFLWLFVAAIYLTRAAIVRSPLGPVVGESIDVETRARLGRLDKMLVDRASLLVAIAVLAGVLESVVAAPYGWLPGALRTLVGVIVGLPPVRVGLGILIVVSLLVYTASRLVQSTYRTSNRDVVAAVVPFLGGLGLVVGAVLLHGQFLSTLFGEIEQRLPAQLEASFEATVDTALTQYGGELLALLVVTSLLVVTLLLVLGLLVTVQYGMRSERVSGASVAAAGLFTTAAFTATLGGSLLLSLLGIVASMIVWDAGEFGATLGAELGRQTTTVRTELAHGGGTLLIGIGMIGLALTVDMVVGRAGTGTSAGLTALLGVVTGVLLLVVASR